MSTQTNPARHEPPEHREGVIRDLLAEKDKLEDRLMELDDVPLLLVYTHLSVDEGLMQRYAPHIKGAWAFEVDDVPDLKRELCRALIATFEDYAANDRPLPPAPPSAPATDLAGAPIPTPATIPEYTATWRPPATVKPKTTKFSAPAMPPAATSCFISTRPMSVL